MSVNGSMKYYFFAMTQLMSHWSFTTENHPQTQGQSMQVLW
jgi:hypothetical protein